MTTVWSSTSLRSTRAHGLVARRIERLTDGDERPHADPFQRRQEVAIVAEYAVRAGHGSLSLRLGCSRLGDCEWP